MTTEIVVAEQGKGVQSASDFMPVFDIQLAVARKQAMTSFIGQILNEGGDYGTVPGTQKPTLLKPGAEKLASFFGLSPAFVYDKVIENWGEDGSEPLFYYRVKCRLVKNGKIIGEADAACSSWESKYRYRWVTEDKLVNVFGEPKSKERLPKRGGVTTLTEPAFAIDKAETTGKYGKPQEHWNMFRAAIQNGTAQRVQKETKAGKPMECWAITVNQVQYQIPNPDIYDQINTILKMAEKRALVAAVLIATNASDSFTQDLEDGQQESEQPSRTSQGPATPSSEDDLPPWEEMPAAAPQKPVAPPPQPPPTADVHPAVQALWKRMGTKMDTILDVLGEMKNHIVALTGSDTEYYRILLNHGLKHANQKGTTIGAYKGVVQELHEFIAFNQAERRKAVNEVVMEADIEPKDDYRK